MNSKSKSEDKVKLGPLDGIRIIECATWHAAPGGSAILADLGAEVIKIETLRGDPERHTKWLGTVKFDMKGGPDWSFLYELSNRNKKGICLDIKSEKGRRILDRLVQDADVFVTNLKPASKAKLAVDYDTLSRINPKLIYAGFSGFGPKGPMGNSGGFDALGQAISGMSFLANNKEPIFLQTMVLDQMASVSLSHAILAALVARERQGLGQEVHVSLYSSALMLTHANLLCASMLNSNPLTQWDRSKNPPLRNNFKCKDGKWIVGTNHPEEKYWPIICKVIGMPELETDPRFSTPEDRMKNATELIKILDPVFLQKTQAEWMESVVEAGLMFAPIQELMDVIKDPQALANDYIVDFSHPVFGNIKIPGYSASFSVNSAGTVKAAPGLGEHTDQVMKEIGMSDSDIQALREEKVIK